jgi:hypothetical protein
VPFSVRLAWGRMVDVSRTPLAAAKGLTFNGDADLRY